MEIKEEVVKEEKQEPPIVLKFAPGWKRAVAFFIDFLLLYIAIIFMTVFVYYHDLKAVLQLKDTSNISNVLSDHSIQIGISQFLIQKDLYIQIAFFIISCAYFMLFWKAGGQTLGAKIMKIVVMTLDRKRLSLTQGLIRYGILYLASKAFFIPLLININPVYQQRIHDLFSGSIVVEIPEINDKKDDPANQIPENAK